MIPIEKLKKADQIKGKVMEFIKPGDLIELAKLSEIPHYVVENPFTKEETYCFLQEEITEWFLDFVRRRVRTIAPLITFMKPDLPELISGSDLVPQGLAMIRDIRKIPLSAFYTTPGIYFLCLDGEIVYIGQALNASKRLLSHYGEKDFDSVFFISCHVDQLFPLESALIRYYSPRLNIAEAGHPLKPDHLDCLKKLGIQVGGPKEKNQQAVC